MPEYSTIQTYIRCNEDKFKEKLVQFQFVLREIGFSEDYIQENFKSIEWIEEENGFIYTGCSLEGKAFEFENYTLKLRPLIMGWTPRVSDDIKENWIEFELLFETNEIVSDFRTGKLKQGIKELIIGYMMNFFRYFYEEGIYFTDEAADGMPWEALIGSGEKAWSFDIAVVPPHLEYFYSPIPAEFSKHIIEGTCLYINDHI